MAELSESTMQRAVSQRDASYDQTFVYGVVTTGICCIPSCRSRAARPENRRFFADLATALIAGFRPCKKCCPAGRATITDKLVETARYIEANVRDNSGQSLTARELANRVGLSTGQLRRGFQSAFGLTPKAMIDGIRQRVYRAALRADEPVTQAIYAAGFGSTSRVYGSKSRSLGMSPKTYGRGAEGERVTYLVKRTPMGMLLMAATARGVCSVEFADSKADLVARLEQEFPNAIREAVSEHEVPMLSEWLAELMRYLEDSGPRPDMPLDLRGSAFQLLVWNYLLELQEGDTVSYGELAQGIGKPRAVRAAASACGANRLAVLVPCHRVLRGDGSIGGYRWGADRKLALLEKELGKEKR